jgi:hypothetical protein
LKRNMVLQHRVLPAAPAPARQQLASHMAATGCALSMMSPSSVARSSGMVATATSPALTTASQASAMPIELPPRSSTRLPGTSPGRGQVPGDAIDPLARLRVGEGDMRRAQHGPVGPTPPPPCPAGARPG